MSDAFLASADGRIDLLHPVVPLRDYFAAAVLGAIYHDGIGLGREQTEIAVEAYEIADAMLEARKAVPA